MTEQPPATARITTNHDAIRRWAEKRGGKPAAVKSTHRKNDPGIIRLMFPDSGYADDQSLEEISWEEFFDKFEEAKLALLYQEETSDQQKSLFSKLIGRDIAEARRHGEAHAARHERARR